MKRQKFIKHTSSLLTAALVFVGLTSSCFAFATPQKLPSDHRTNHRIKHGTSSNWSGYAAYGTPGSFNSVSASWIQPSVICTSQNTYSSYWVGIDGYNTSTVEQLGTEADCSKGAPVYYSWFEMYPHWAYYANLQVHPGDSYTASVTYQNRSNYLLKITDNTTKRSFSTTQRLNAQRASVEVVVEAPWSGSTLPLANFGSANFTNALANNQPLGGFTNLDPITMVNPSGAKSTPSSFDSTKQNFSLTYSSQ